MQWVPWAISAVALTYTVLKDLLGARSGESARRRALDEVVEKRLQALEVGRQVDQVKLDGDLRVINEKMQQVAGHVGQTRQLVKSVLDNA